MLSVVMGLGNKDRTEHGTENMLLETSFQDDKQCGVSRQVLSRQGNQAECQVAIEDTPPLTWNSVKPT